MQAIWLTVFQSRHIPSKCRTNSRTILQRNTSVRLSPQVQMSLGHQPAHRRRLPHALRRHHWQQAHECQPQSPTPPRHGSLGRSNKRTMHYKKMTTEESNLNPNFIWVPLSKLLQHCIHSAYVPAFSLRHLSPL